MSSSHTSHGWLSSSRQPRRRREHALAALLIAGFIVVFLWTPLRSYRTSLYTPAELTQISSLTRVDPAHRVANPILGDVVLQMQPWLLFGREELRAGRMPLWNPYNGGGTPHFANYQSAVLSPFSLPFYVLSLKNALLVAAFLKLFCLGYFTYLFLREIELVFAAAIIGAVAFMFAGHNVLLLGYPHPAAMVTLPLGLFFAERACRRFERGPGVTREHSPREPASPASLGSGPARTTSATHAPSALDTPHVQFSLRDSAVRDVGVGPFLGFGAALVVGLFAGQPEPFYFCAVLIALYVSARLARMWMQSRRDGASLRSIGLFTGAFFFVFALAIGIAAVQLVPFFEYLKLSRLLEQRSAVQTPLSLMIWPLLMFPNLLGNPSTNYQVDSALPPPDFETASLVYCGGIVLFLALISLLFVGRNRYHAFFAGAALVWFVYAYDLAGAWQIFALIPSVELAPINRSQGVVAFCLAACAAFAVHHLVHVRVPIRSMLFASTLFAGLVMLATFVFGAQHLAVYAYGYLKAFPGREAIYQYSTPHIVHIASSYLPAILALSAMLLAPQGRLRRTFTVVILVSVFIQTGYLFRNYNSTSEERFVFPKTAAVSELAESVGPNYLAVLGADTIIPDSNMVYRIAQPASYDGMWISRYDRLYREIFGEGNNWRPISRGTRQGLELFGVDYVLNKGDWIGIDAPFADVPENPRAFYATDEILPGADVVQTFTALSDRLHAVRVFAGSRGRVAACTLRLSLEDSRDGRTIAARDYDCRVLSADASQRTSLVFAFEPIADSRGRRFRLRASSSDARAGSGVSLWCRSDWTHWINLALWRATLPRTLVLGPPPTARHDELHAWRVIHGTELLEGGLLFDFSSSRDAFRTVRTIGEHTLYELEDAPSRFHFVSRAVPVESDEQAFARVQSPEFDPKVAVVLDESDVGVLLPPRGGNEQSAVRIVSEEPTRIRLEVAHRQPGWLVMAKPWFPGWIAHVDGEERDVARANYAFSAVRVATGESVVELEYDPPSFRRGLWISGLSSLCAALCVTLLALRARAARAAA